MLQIIIALAGALSTVLVTLYHVVTANRLKRDNEKLATLNKLREIQNRGLREARDFAAGQLKDKNAQLAKDPAASLDDFFGVRKD